ncbi:MAG: sensor histidine kinase [Planktomarina sp.]
MKILSTDDFRSQYEALAAMETLASTELRIRLGTIGTSVLIGFFAFQVWQPLVWFFFYGCLLYVQHSFTLSAKARPQRGALKRLAWLNFGIALVFVSLPVGLWYTGDILFRVAALGLSAGGILHSVAHRARMPLYALGDAAANCLFLIYVCVTLVLALEGAGERTILTVMFAAMVFYYMNAMLSVFRLRANLRAATQRSADAQKMQAIGQLTRGVAHDFNNILTVVMGNLDLHSEASTKEEKDRLAQDSYIAAHRASTLTAQLLAFSRQSTLLPEAIDLDRFVGGFWQMAQRIVPDTIDFKSDIPRRLPDVQADRGQFESALLNLTLNAADAMPDGGRLRITAKAINVSFGSKLALGDGLPVGDYVQVMISDTGHGIPNHLQSQVFDPFFTTKPFGDGSGLGLSMAKGFAEQSKGCLLLDSRPGVGTVFSLILPIALPDLKAVNDGMAPSDEDYPDMIVAE